MKPTTLRFTLACVAMVGLAGCAAPEMSPGVGGESESFNYLSVWESQLPDPDQAERTQDPHGAAR